MSAALGVLMVHRYGTQGGAPAICLDLAGNPTRCKWKARRNSDGYGIQHLRHQADLIDQAYTVDIIELGLLRSIRDHVTSALDFYASMPPTYEFARGRHQHVRELADILGIDQGGV